jgi:response regulator of citrate/malate metabolism
MSTKKVHLYNMAFERLMDLCMARCRPSTAGEFAIYMGIARSTAVRWLEEMESEGAICHEIILGKNRLTVRRFEPVGQGKTWHYHYAARGEKPQDG